MAATATVPMGTIEATPTEVALAKGRNAVRRAYDKVKDLVVRGWKAFLRGLRWSKDKVMAAARWTKDKVTRGATWVIDHAKSAVGWTKDAVKGAWEFTAPFRTWVATPFRAALTTTGGLAAMMLLGGKFVVLGTMVWITYLLITGRLQMAEKAKVTLDGNGKLVLTETQENALIARSEELDEQLAAMPEAKQTRAYTSAYAARQYLIAQRRELNNESPSELGIRFKKAMIAEMGEDPANVHFDWRAVTKAMKSEHMIVLNRLQATQPEPVLVK
jgi:hypothetical protein